MGAFFAGLRAGLRVRFVGALRFVAVFVVRFVVRFVVVRFAAARFAAVRFAVARFALGRVGTFFAGLRAGLPVRFVAALRFVGVFFVRTAVLRVGVRFAGLRAGARRVEPFRVVRLAGIVSPRAILAEVGGIPPRRVVPQAGITTLPAWRESRTSDPPRSPRTSVPSLDGASR